MKKIFTLSIAISFLVNANSQAILNEVYAFPGGARNEFFEFYNNSNSTVSMDNYTIITYFEEGAKTGFYVLDLPNLMVTGRGFFVGSSAIPFNYQGVTNSTNSNYSWNDLSFMSANSAYLKKWELSTTVPAVIDGNAGYDLATIPANFNDIFQKVGGGGASYNVFVYKNGNLLSVFLGGTGGASFIPSYIVGLPNLFVDMAGAGTDFTIPFSTYTNARSEYVIQDIGSDNGYIRLNDGYCGMWTKSSSQVTHTPGVTNGGTEIATPVVSISAGVTPGNAITGSTVTYDVVGAPAIEFPITLNLFVDNGTVPNELDVNDTYLTSVVENTLSDGPFSTVFFPHNANILIQATTSANCIDNVRFIPTIAVLPVRFTGFTATVKSHAELRWYVADNASAGQYEVEKSTDGRNFQTIALVLPTSQKEDENYIYKDQSPKVKTWYRIKLTDINGKISYTNILAVGNTMETSGSLSLNQNPVESYLTFNFKSKANSLGTINIYNTSGILVYSQKTNFSKDMNSITINLDGKVFPGMYILEVKTNYDRSSIKFISR